MSSLPLRLYITALVLCLGVTTTAKASNPIKVVTDRSPVVLENAKTIILTVKNVPGSGPIRGDVNIGAIEKLEQATGDLRIHYRLPTTRSPQMLCLTIWRDTGISAKVHHLRLPLLGESKIPVRTRAYSRVTVRIGKRIFGPINTGARGRATIKVLVPPGIREAHVEVTDKNNLKTSKLIQINQPSYNQLGLSLHPHTTPSGVPRFRISVALAQPEGPEMVPRVQVGEEVIALKKTAKGAWDALWAPKQRPPEGQIQVHAWLPGHPSSKRFAKIGIEAAKVKARISHVQPPPDRKPERPEPKRLLLRGHFGLMVGMLHNLGEVLSPRFSLDVGLSYPLPVGRIGGRLFISVSWASQQIAASKSGLEDAESSVLLLPIGAGVIYRLPLKYLTPSVTVGCLAQIVRTKNSAPYAQERRRHDVAFGVVGLIGAERRLNPGRLVLQMGYQWSDVENQDLNLSAGGVILEGGYQLEL